MALSRFSERTAEIVRGWPQGAALDRVEPIKASVLKSAGGTGIGNGQWVYKLADNTIDVAGATATNAVGLVVSGDLDSFSSKGSQDFISGGGSLGSGKAVVLWGNFLASINSNGYTGTFVPGDSFTVVSGKVKKGVVGTDPIVGRVLEVVTSTSTNDATILIQVS